MKDHSKPGNRAVKLGLDCFEPSAVRTGLSCKGVANGFLIELVGDSIWMLGFRDLDIDIENGRSSTTGLKAKEVDKSKYLLPHPYSNGHELG